jgi:hypothetical protein
VGVVVEALHEALPHVVVEEGVVGDVVRPLLELLLVRQFAVQEEVGHLEVRGLLGQLVDRVAPVPQDAGVAVEIRDGAGARRRRQEGGVVHPEVGVELAQGRRGERAVDERDGDLLAGSIVDDGDGVRHRSRPFARLDSRIATHRRV